jgi:FG-GAP-like repeat
MNRAAVALIVLSTACGSPSNHDLDPDAGSNAPDAAVVTPPDAALPVLGTTCPDRLDEVKRITMAADAYPYAVNNVLVGKFDNNPSDDIVLLETEYDSTNQRTLLRFKTFLTSGTGFAAPVVSNAVFPQYGPEQVLLGDFNGDHLMDILIAYTDSEDTSRVSYVYVATQQADHTFVLGAAINVSACKSSSDERYFALGVLDVDRDGKDDLLATVSYDGLGAAPAGLSWLHGGASGLGQATCARSATMQNAGFPPQMVTAEKFRIGDFDGDGTDDIAALYDTQMLLYRNTAASTFVTATQPATFDSSIRIATDPVNHGLIGLDVGTTTSTATRFKTDTTGFSKSTIGTFATEGAPDGNYDVIRGFAVGDFNGDGLTDVLEVGNHNYSSSTPGFVSFGMACDRSAHWDWVGGGFTDSVYDVQPIGFAGSTDLVVEDGYDLVLYSITP